MDYRIEKDTMGEVKVPADKLWGAQTERSRHNFAIGEEKMPSELIHAIAMVKAAAAKANCRLGVLSEDKRDRIVAVAEEIVEGKWDDQFPLSVWQTGSGTQTNMNVNEVIANRANLLAGEKVLHPNDDVNRSQSSNDVFPTAMHIAANFATDRVEEEAGALIEVFERLQNETMDAIKCGRTHLQDAVPLSFGQEVSGWRGMLESSVFEIKSSGHRLRELAMGATAVGTGLNAPEGFDLVFVEEISNHLKTSFAPANNKFYALSAKDALVFAHGALKALACNMMKIANDIRWLASGPRCGLGEISIPQNEPGSSIMPGKVNPTQCEAVTMVAVQVMANDQAIAMGASQGNFELNVYMPVIIYNYLQSARLLKDAIRSFRIHCAEGIQVNRDKMKAYLDRSLMLATALNPYIGYEKAAEVAKKAYRENISLKEACVALGYLTAEEYDKIVEPLYTARP